MLFVLIVLLLVASVFVLLMKKNRESLCLLGMWTPALYVGWRARAHAAGRLRCDWLAVLASTTVRA